MSFAHATSNLLALAVMTDPNGLRSIVSFQGCIHTFLRRSTLRFMDMARIVSLYVVAIVIVCVALYSAAIYRAPSNAAQLSVRE